MIFHCRDWKRWLFVVCAAMGAAFPASAQRQGQQIIFSQPDSDAVTNSVPSLTPPAPTFPDFVKNGLSPSPIPIPPSLQPPPVPVQVMNPGQTAAGQLELDRQKNWTLLTPAEILGVPTVENTLGLSERNAAGETKNQTALERYLERQQQARNAAMTNTINSSALSDWSMQRREQPEWNSDFSAARNNSFFSAVPDNRRDANQNTGGGWLQPAGSSTPTVQTPEQLEAARVEAENFQKLLQPGLAASSSAKTKPAFSWPESAPNSSLPSENSSSIGNSFTPLGSDVKTPQGVTPLPGPISGKNPSTTPVVPEWKRKLPPWWSAQPSPDKNFDSR